MKAIFVSTPFCVKCKLLRSHIEKKEGSFEMEYIDASTQEGLKFARTNDITSVPTLLLYEGHEQIGVAKDIDDLEKFL